MKKIVGMVLIILLLGSIVATTGSMVQAAVAEAHDDAYKKLSSGKFWTERPSLWLEWRMASLTLLQS